MDAKDLVARLLDPQKHDQKQLKDFHDGNDLSHAANTVFLGYHRDNDRVMLYGVRERVIVPVGLMPIVMLTLPHGRHHGRTTIAYDAHVDDPAIAMEDVQSVAQLLGLDTTYIPAMLEDLREYWSAFNPTHA
jgi:hypothetical protein